MRAAAWRTFWTAGSSMASSSSSNARITTNWNRPYAGRVDRIMDGPPGRGGSEVGDDLAAGAGGQGLQGLELDAGADGPHAAVAEAGVGELVEGARAGQPAGAATVDIGPVVAEPAVDAHG